MRPLAAVLSLALSLGLLVLLSEMLGFSAWLIDVTCSSSEPPLTDAGYLSCKNDVDHTRMVFMALLSAVPPAVLLAILRQRKKSVTWS